MIKNFENFISESQNNMPEEYYVVGDGDGNYLKNRRRFEITTDLKKAQKYESEWTARSKAIDLNIGYYHRGEVALDDSGKRKRMKVFRVVGNTTEFVPNPFDK